DLALHPSGPPASPTLQPASDTGVSDSDGYTDDHTPTFDTFPNSPPDSTGPAAYLYANGDLVSAGLATDFSVVPWPVTSSTLSDGVFDFQLVTVYLDPFGDGQTIYGPASPRTRVVIVADAMVGGGAEDDGVCYMRRG